MLRTLADISVVVFGFGIVGSAVVVIITFVEDIRELGSDKELPAEAKADVAEAAK
jgi:hypothetical protein